MTQYVLLPLLQVKVELICHCDCFFSLVQRLAYTGVTIGAKVTDSDILRSVLNIKMLYHNDIFEVRGFISNALLINKRY